MTVQTIAPAATASLDAANVLVVGAATAHAALADASDATYVQGHSYDGHGAGQAVVTFPAPATAGQRVARVRANLRAQDLDNQGTTVRADLTAGQAAQAGYASSTPTVLAAALYTGPWFAYRPAGGRWGLSDVAALAVLLAFISGATAAGANALALTLDVDVVPVINTRPVRDTLAQRTRVT